MPRKETISLLVTVKAYPAISQRYGEVVCVAGIRTDTAQPEWARLWPVPFRDLTFQAQFKKYQIITLKATQPAGSDTRPESWRPDNDSIVKGGLVDTKSNWGKRKPYVMPLVAESMCEVRRRQERDGTSLAVFQPAEVQEFIIEKDVAQWDPNQQAVVAQPSLLLPTKSGLEKIPFRFKYRYRCADSHCRGHLQSIIDWEAAQSYRNFRDAYSADHLPEKLRERWLDRMWGSDKDSFLFVGNQRSHPDAFLVLGVFYPKASAKG